MGRVFKVIFVFLVLVMLVIIGGAAYLFYAIRQPPPLAKEMRTVETSPGEAVQFDSKLQDLEQQFRERQRALETVAQASPGTPGPTPPPLQVTLTEQEVSSKINAVLQQSQQTPPDAAPVGPGTPTPAPPPAAVAGDVPIRDVKVNFQGTTETVRAVATWEYRGFSGQVAGEAATHVDQGKIKVDIMNIQVGGAGVPSQIVNEVLSNVEKYAGELKLPDWVQGIKVTADGKLTVTSK